MGPSLKQRSPAVPAVLLQTAMVHEELEAAEFQADPTLRDY